MLSHDFNRTMLFHIGRSEIQLINPEVKSVQLNKHFRDIAHCCQVSAYYTEREMIQWLMVFTDMMIIIFYIIILLTLLLYYYRLCICPNLVVNWLLDFMKSYWQTVMKNLGLVKFLVEGLNTYIVWGMIMEI